jgi:hypothetical protein
MMRALVASSRFGSKIDKQVNSFFPLFSLTPAGNAQQLGPKGTMKQKKGRGTLAEQNGALRRQSTKEEPEQDHFTRGLESLQRRKNRQAGLPATKNQ